MRCWIVLVMTFVTVGVAAQERLVPLPTRKALAAMPARPEFVVGVYMQPPDLFEVWRLRGINTLVGYESRGGKISNEEWSRGAAGMGFYYMRAPSGDLAGDARDRNLLAWMHADEPDVRKPPTPPEQLQADYARWKGAGPNVPVFVNFSGGYVLGGRVPRETYVEYMKAADWVGNDFYPVTGYHRVDWLWKVGAAVDQLREWSGGKPQFAFIETSAQRLPWTPKTARGVTPDELRGQVWHAVIHGVKGVVYFPQQIGEGFRYDATPTRVALEMGRQNKRLNELGAVLGSGANPAGVSVTAERPLEAGWRVHGGAVYVIVLNFSDEAVEGKGVTVTGAPAGGAVRVEGEERAVEMVGGRIVDDFGPYGVRIYRIATSP